MTPTEHVDRVAGNLAEDEHVRSLALLAPVDADRALSPAGSDARRPETIVRFERRLDEPLARGRAA